jgi:hypothetical protein
MTALVDIAAWSFLAFGLLLLISQLVLHEAGYRLGRWQSSRVESPSDGVGVVIGAMLGLLAFVLALTLSFANARFSERRAGTLAEANAIGTAWLRAEAIGHPRGTEIARLIEQYAQMRIDFVRDGYNSPDVKDLNQRTNALQSKIWGHLAAIVREQPNPISTALQASLNDMFDMTTAERFAYELQLPPQIFWLLIGLALLGMASLGYQTGLRGKSVRILAALLTLTWTVVIVDILDLASARFGSFRASAAIYESTLKGFQGGLTIPPAPGP